MSYSQLVKEALEEPCDAKALQRLKDWHGELPETSPIRRPKTS